MIRGAAVAMSAALTAEARLVLQTALASSRACVCLEGNIGAGKSLVQEILARRGHVTVSEPVSSWNLLQPFYADPKRYAFAVQVQIMTSYSHLGELAHIISERGPSASLYVFAEMQRAEGNLSEHQMRLLTEIYETLPIPRPTALVYLDVPLAACMERIARRNRPGEDAISRTYMEKLAAAYDVYCERMARGGVAVLRIAAADFDGRPEELADEVELALLRAMQASGGASAANAASMAAIAAAADGAAAAAPAGLLPSSQSRQPLPQRPLPQLGAAGDARCSAAALELARC